MRLNRKLLLASLMGLSLSMAVGSGFAIVKTDPRFEPLAVDAKGFAQTKTKMNIHVIGYTAEEPVIGLWHGRDFNPIVYTELGTPLVGGGERHGARHMMFNANTTFSTWFLTTHSANKAIGWQKAYVIPEAKVIKSTATAPEAQIKNEDLLPVIVLPIIVEQYGEVVPFRYQNQADFDGAVMEFKAKGLKVLNERNLEIEMPVAVLQKVN